MIGQGQSAPLMVAPARGSAGKAPLLSLDRGRAG